METKIFGQKRIKYDGWTKGVQVKSIIIGVVTAEDFKTRPYFNDLIISDLYYRQKAYEIN